MDIKGKSVVVIGAGKSGIGAANLLSELGADVTITDIKTEKALKDFIEKLNPSVKLVLGGHPEWIFNDIDLIVISPGVPMDIPPLKVATEKGIKIIGELELAYQIVKSDKLRMPTKESFFVTCNSSPHFLAVTGTNGKSTTAVLLDLMLRKGGSKTILGGNIGNALTEALRAMRYALPDFIVAEVSSFQLESIEDFRPKVAAILNITPNHLDRYYSFKEYSNAKARIFENQREEDFLVINADDPVTIKVKSEKLKAKSERPKIFYFSRKKKVEGVYLRDGMIYCNFPNFSLTHYPLLMADEINMRGAHNIENAMAAAAMALLSGCPLDAVVDSLREFSGLEHRLEFVREIDGVMYFNDSKATNVGAVIKSLEAFTEPIILIAGGRDKGGDFSVLRHLVKEKVKTAILIGESVEKLKKAFEDITNIAIARDLIEAVNISHSIAVKGDVVILSPGCASFDMFADFEDRGRQFKQAVMDIWS